LLKITLKWLYIDHFEWISYHICWFLSFGVLAKIWFTGITRIWPYIDYFGIFSCHFWWFLSFGVLAKARAALQDLVYVLWQNNLRLFKNFRSPEESKILLKTHFTGNRLIIANFHWILTDSCHICWFRVSVLWQKHELLCGILYKFCDKTIWDYLKFFEVLRNPRFSRKHNSP